MCEVKIVIVAKNWNQCLGLYVEMNDSKLMLYIYLLCMTSQLSTKSSTRYIELGVVFSIFVLRIRTQCKCM